MFQNKRFSSAINFLTTMLFLVSTASTVVHADVLNSRDHHATMKVGKQAVNHKDIPVGLHSAITAARTREAFAIKPITSGDTEVVYEAINRPNDLRFAFDCDGMVITPNSIGLPSWQLRMTLNDYTYEDSASSPYCAKSRNTVMSADGNRIEYSHTFSGGISHTAMPIIEWYVNDTRGLEQGFTLTAPPKRGHDPSSPLRLELGIESDAAAELTADGAIRFADSRGKTVLRYSQLHVFDATGQELPAYLDISEKSTVVIVTDDRGAVYPLTIDPLFETEVKLTASDAAAGDAFGYSVAISGDTAVVGAFWDDDNGADSGSAYIYQRDLGGTDNWGEVKKITASDGVAGDQFGLGVSISGDFIIVGAHRNDDAGADSGSAYIYHRNLGGLNNWGEVTKITASDAASTDYFGFDVSISSNAVIVGAYKNDDIGFSSGAAYVFHRNQGGPDNWGEVKKLTASDADSLDQFGFSVSISGDTSIVGAYSNADAGLESGSSYIFQRDQGGTDNWGEVIKLTASDANARDAFGFSVAISGNTAIIGAKDDDDILSNAGSAYIFYRDLGGPNNWGEVTEIRASDAGSPDLFGWSVSIDGDMAIVGAINDDHAGNFSGSAYIFQRDLGGADNWGEVIKLTASDAAGDNFSHSISISGFTTIVGAWANDDAGLNSGSAYIYYKLPVCGDNIIDFLETCDDGNTNLCDGCDAECQIENCDDSIACTIDSCDLILGCLHDTSECVQPPLPLAGEPGFSKDRYVSFNPSTNGTALVAIRVTRVGGTVKYVDCTQVEDQGADGFYARLIDGPLPPPGDSTYYCDWSGITTGIHVRGCTIVPGNTYEVALTAGDGIFSTPLAISTTLPQFGVGRQFGDTVGSLVAGAWTAPDGLVTTNDIVAPVFKFLLRPTAPITARIDTDGVVTDAFINVADILRAARGFAGQPFGYGVTSCLTGTCVPPNGCANDVTVDPGNVVFDLVPIGSTGPVTNLVGNSIEISGGGVVIELELRVSNWGTTGDGNLLALQGAIDGTGYCSGSGDPLYPLGFPGAPVLTCPQGNGCPVDGDTCENGGFITTERCTIGGMRPPTGIPCDTSADCPGEICIDVDLSQYVFGGQDPIRSIAFSGLNYEYAGVSQAASIPDFGDTPGFGTLLIEVPAGALGTYNINYSLDSQRTITIDGADKSFAVVNLNGATITVTPGAPETPGGEIGFDKDRYVSFDPTTAGTNAVAIRVTRVGSTTDKYVDCTSLQNKGADGFYATLIDGPLPLPPNVIYYCDLSGVTTGLHVRGCSVVPGNSYNIAMTVDGSTFSTALSIPTTPPQWPSRSFGDTVGSLVGGIWTAPDGLVTTNDIVAVVKKFGLDPNAPIMARVDTDSLVPNAVVSSGDILRAVRAFAGDFFGSGVTGCTTGVCVPPQAGACE